MFYRLELNQDLPFAFLEKEEGSRRDPECQAEIRALLILDIGGKSDYRKRYCLKVFAHNGHTAPHT